MVRLSSDFNAYAIISSRKGILRPGRRAADGHAKGANDENFSYIVERSVVVSHS